MRSFFIFWSLLFPFLIQAQEPVWKEILVTQSYVGETFCYDIHRLNYEHFIISGGFENTLLFGDTSVNSIGKKDAFIAKIDAELNPEWIRIVSGFGDIYSTGISSLSNDDLLFTVVFTDSFHLNGLSYSSLGEEDIALISLNKYGTVNWVKTIVGPGKEFTGIELEVDEMDNIYITGRFGGNGHSPPLKLSAYLDTVKINSEGGADVFLAKYTTIGNLQWVKTAGGRYSDMSFGIKLLKGEIAIAGLFTDPWIQFESTKLYTKVGPFQDMFVAVYDTSGNFLWARGAGNENGASGGSPVIDRDKNVYVTGTYFSDPLNFGSYILPEIGDFDMYVAKYNSTGSLLWAKNGGGGSTDFGGALALDSAGNLYSAGVYSYDGIFGNDTVSGHVRDIFISKLNSSGNYQWVLTAEGTAYESVNDIIITGENEGIVIGTFQSPSVTFGTQTINNAGDQNFFIAKFGPDTSTGIQEKEKTNVKIYPNPSTGGEVHISFPSGAFYGLQVIDLSGRVILEEKIRQVKSSYVIYTSSWTKGIYMIRLFSDQGIVTEPLNIN